MFDLLIWATLTKLGVQSVYYNFFAVLKGEGGVRQTQTVEGGRVQIGLGITSIIKDNISVLGSTNNKFEQT